MKDKDYELSTETKTMTRNHRTIEWFDYKEYKPSDTKAGMAEDCFLVQMCHKENPNDQWISCFNIHKYNPQYISSTSGTPMIVAWSFLPEPYQINPKGCTLNPLVKGFKHEDLDKLCSLYEL